MAKPSKLLEEAEKSSRRRYANGEASRDHVLEVARRVLIRDGYHAFTIRRVADESEMSVGNLTYYFPNKTSLVEAVMEAVFKRYEPRYTEFLANGDPRSGDPTADLVTWFMRDAVTDDTAGLFMELWVMAKHHRFGSEALSRFYDDGVRHVAHALAQQYPDLSEHELERISYFMLTVTEGSTAVFARHGNRAVEHEEIIPLAIEAVKALLGQRSAPTNHVAPPAESEA